MKPYNPKAKCPKCGHNHAATNFDAKGEDKPLGEGGQYERDTLSRRCERCGYTWCEAPRDAKKEDGR
jgi:predicted nucleic-acid-binding Zn-ribbon protein